MSITIAQIHRSIHEGARVANEKYEKWSNGWWISDSGVEGLLVCEIAERLHKHQSQSESLLLEVPFQNIQEWSGAPRPRGRPRAALKGSNRVDIVLLNSQEKPKYIIEVKRLWNNNAGLRDLDRICGLVQACAAGSLKRGFLAVFLAREVRVSHDMRWAIDRIKSSVEQHIEERVVGITEGKISEAESENRKWQSSSLSIEVSAR